MRSFAPVEVKRALLAALTSLVEFYGVNAIKHPRTGGLYASLVYVREMVEGFKRKKGCKKAEQFVRDVFDSRKPADEKPINEKALKLVVSALQSLSDEPEYSKFLEEVYRRVAESSAVKVYVPSGEFEQAALFLYCEFTRSPSPERVAAGLVVLLSAAENL